MERYFKITEIPESEFVKKTGERWIGVQTYGVLDIGVDCDMTSRMVVELEDLEWINKKAGRPVQDVTNGGQSRVNARRSTSKGLLPVRL